MHRTLSSGAPDSLAFCPARIRHVVAALRSDVANSRLPGAVALIAQKGETVLKECVGWQNPADATPMALDSIFRIYSMTKPVVSVAILMLMERGQLLLGDPVAKYLPEFANLRVANHVDGHAVLQPLKSIPTVQDLLRHTAGFTYEILGSDVVQRQYAQARLASRTRTNREFAQALAALPLAFEPATVWEYSRATDVLGALLEVVTGQTLGAFLQDNIFTPLGMSDTGFCVPPDKHHRIAEPFARDPDGNLTMKLIDIRQQPVLESGGAAWPPPLGTTHVSCSVC